MWKDVFSRHHPGPALGRLYLYLQELPAATGLHRGQEHDPGGGAEMVLERRQDGGQRQEGDGASADTGSTGSTRLFAAGASGPVHRGWFTASVVLELFGKITVWNNHFKCQIQSNYNGQN